MNVKMAEEGVDGTGFPADSSEGPVPTLALAIEQRNKQTKIEETWLEVLKC